MQNTKLVIIGILGGIVLSGCASLGFKSTPWPNYTPVHDEKAVEFIREIPAVESGVLSGSEENTDYSLDDNLVLGISVTGGGIRAAAFTLGVLDGLQQQGLLQDVDFISSNSGGGWGIAAYVADLSGYNDDAPYSLKARRLDITNKFRDMAENKTIKCLAASVGDHLTNNKTYGEIFGPTNSRVPDHFVNAAILPGESPFVFSNEYLNYFQITEMDACNEKRYQHFNVDTSGSSGSSILNVPYGFAVATSGSVPLFYASSAKTSICKRKGPLWESSFCSQDQNTNHDELHLVDGGIHDNHAYKTAAEIFSEYQSGQRSCSLDGPTRCGLLMIDSTTNIISPFTTGAAKRFKGYKLASGFGTGSGFVGQDSTVNRLRKPLFNALGTHTVALNFFAAADLEGKNFDYDPMEANFKDLNHLRAYMRDSVVCYENNGKIITADPDGISSKSARERSAKRFDSDDCTRNNAYRAGTLAKTTYDFDEDAGMFPILWDLGVFVVRQKSEMLDSIKTQKA